MPAKRGLNTASAAAGLGSVAGNKLATDAPVVNVTTAAGKVLDGVMVADKAQALAVDKFTWKPKGMDGYFVRMRHVIRPQLDVTKFALVSGGATGVAGPVGSVSRADANKVVARVRSRLGGRVSGIMIVDDFAGLPEKVRKDAIAQGVTRVLRGYREGMVYAVLDTHKTTEQFEQTIFHELHGHMGLDHLFGAQSQRI